MDLKNVYNNPLGRLSVVLMQKAGLFQLASLYLKSGLSKRMVEGYIAKNQINMKDFEGQEYHSFADFFARKKKNNLLVLNTDMLISPCDGLLSVYPITNNLIIPMKGSYYRFDDIVPDSEVAAQFREGICLVFRLQASDYHHFCVFDDAMVKRANYIPGELHSVQPIACEKLPVYRLNRRWWSLLETRHFGNAIQVEVGAMLVGGVNFVKESGWLYRGEEMGNFELAGSTIILIFSSEIRKGLKLEARFEGAYEGATEIPVTMGEEIGVVRNEEETGIIRSAVPVPDWRSSI